MLELMKRAGTKQPSEAVSITTASLLTPAFTGEGRRPREELQTKGIGHLDHGLLRGWEDGLGLISAAEEDGDIKATPARINSRSDAFRNDRALN